MEDNYKGLLKTYKEFTFLKTNDLIRYYVSNFYPNKTIAVIYDCKEATEAVPKISILKRDNYLAYIKATTSDIIIVEFNSISEAEDWLYSFKMNIKWEIYKDKKLVKNNKGNIKYG